MRRYNRYGIAATGWRFAILAFMLVTASCDRERAAGPARSEYVELDQLPLKRTMRGGDWRDSRLLSAGDHAVDLGGYRGEGRVQIGFTPQGPPRSASKATVFVGEVAVDTITCRRPLEWTDAIVDISKQAALGDAIRVAFSSDVALRVSRCDLAAPSSEHPNVLVFLVDTMRRDHLGCYGYLRDTSPNFDRLASEGVRFDGMISQSSWTRPAVASLLTGTYPVVHGVRDRSDVVRQELTTLGEAFRNAGYRTQAYMSNPNCMPTWGFGKGFTRFLSVNSFNLEPDKDAHVVDAVLEEMLRLRGAPWFLYVHAIGPHFPYERHGDPFTGMSPRHDKLTSQQQALVNNYDAEIRFTDAQYGRIVEALRANGTYDETAIVVVSDHGEQFWEHGQMGHGHSLHDEEIRVPMIVKLPNSDEAGTTISGIAELVDIGPTLLAVAGLQSPPTFQGRSLLPQILGTQTVTHNAYMSLYVDDKAQYGARSATTKFIHDFRTGTTDWYNLQTDPTERHAISMTPEGGDGLMRFAERIVASRGEGLYVMVTGSLQENHTIAGTIRGAELTEPCLYYAARNGEVSVTDDVLTFRITTSPGSEAPLDLVEWQEQSAEQNHGIVKVKLDSTRPARVSISLDGRPAPASMVFVGPERTHILLKDTALEPQALIASSTDYAPITLPRRLAVYVWYVPGTESIAAEALEPDMSDALAALGYL